MAARKWILKILGKPSEEELAQKVHDIAIAQLPVRRLEVLLHEGEEGYEEAEKLLGSHSARGFRVQNMCLKWSPKHDIRESHHLGWVSDHRGRIWVSLYKTFPGKFG